MDANPNSLDSSATPPRKHQLFPWLFNRQLLGRLLFSFVTLATITALFYATQYWRGRFAWHRCRAAAVSRGEEVNLSAFVPPTVPDDQNFALTPCLKPLFDFIPGTQQWRDTNAFQQAVALFTRLRTLAREKGFDFDSGKPSRWAIGERVDLVALLGSNRSHKALTPAERAAIAQNSPGQEYRANANASSVTNVQPTTQPQAAQVIIDLVNSVYGDWLAEVKSASQKPACRFPINYDTVPASNILLPHLAVLKGAVMSLYQRALAELALNQNQAAADDVQLCLLLADTLKNEPLIISQLVRFACRNIAIGAIWEGCADHRWSEAQLVALQSNLATNNLIADLPHVLLGERAFSLRMIDQLRHNPELLLNLGFSENSDQNIGAINVAYQWMPSGWFYLEQVNLMRTYEEELVPLQDWLQGKAPLKTVLDADAALASPPDGPTPWLAFRHHKYLARLLVPSVSGTITKAILTQTRSLQALTALALERYFRSNHHYPAKLSDLVPTFTAKPPLDPFSGDTLKYSLSSGNTYVLYSVGFNQTDDGGVPDTNPRGSSNPQKMDIVWRIPDGVSPGN
jgi:hypothetical protein